MIIHDLEWEKYRIHVFENFWEIFGAYWKVIESEGSEPIGLGLNMSCQLKQ